MRFTYTERDEGFLETAPTKLIDTVELNCSPAQLFELLEDETVWPKWLKLLTKVQWTSPKPHGVGTTRRVTLRGGLEVDESFFVWEPGRRLAFFLTSGLVPVETMAEDYVVNELGDGRCELEWTMAIKPLWGLGPAMKVIAPGMQAANRLALRDLRRYVDTHVRG